MKNLQEPTQPDLTDSLLLLAGLGSKQKDILKLLLNGHHISVFQDMSEMKQFQHVSDDDNNELFELTEPFIRSLVNRKILLIQNVYSTVQPDTATYKMTIRPELSSAVQMACQ